MSRIWVQRPFRYCTYVLVPIFQKKTCLQLTLLLCLRYNTKKLNTEKESKAMSSVSENIYLQIPYDQAIIIIRKVALSFGSLIEEGSTFKIKETVQRTIFSTSWPATVTIEANEINNRTHLLITASNFGMGPLQKNECSSKLGAVKTAILLKEQELSQQKPLKEQPSGADEILKYKSLLDSGIITSEEFEHKKKQILGM